MASHSNGLISWQDWTSRFGHLIQPPSTPSKNCPTIRSLESSNPSMPLLLNHTAAFSSLQKIWTFYKSIGANRIWLLTLRRRSWTSGDQYNSWQSSKSHPDRSKPKWCRSPPWHFNTFWHQNAVEVRQCPLTSGRDPHLGGEKKESLFINDIPMFGG